MSPLLTVSLAVFLAFSFHSASFAEMRGVWAECEGVNSTFESREKMEEMFARLREARINTVFMQVYRGNRAWYRSNIADPSPYAAFYAREKMSPLRLAIDLAHKNGMELHAWINVFRVRGDRGRPVIRKLGRGAVAVDRNGRSLLDYEKALLPDGGLWLDPGDPAVREYAISVIAEILDRYPDLDGIHLDYVRYPYDELGKIDYGYGVASVAAFRRLHGINPRDRSRRERRLWDDWRREQVTLFISQAGKVVGARGKKLSAAVMADEGKSRDLAFQDWPGWARENLIDFAVPMNYGSRSRRVRKRTEAILKSIGAGKAAIGLGAYKVLDAPEELARQIRDCLRLGAMGVVLFSYDNMTKNTALFPYLGKKVWGGGKVRRIGGDGEASRGSGDTQR